MDDAAPSTPAPVEATPFLCTQCGGELHPDAGQIFLTCPYCGASVYLDRSKVVFHWALEPTLDEQKAAGALKRWMAGNETVKDLDQKSSLQSAAFEYFPVWQFKYRLKGGAETEALLPAAATSVSEIQRLTLPTGDLHKYTADLDGRSRLPTVPLPAAESWLNQQRGVPVESITERTLVHLPIYTFKYAYKNKPYTALVEAGTGRVFANIFPAKAEAPYLVIGMATALTFLCLALMPLIFGLGGSGGGAGIGLGICIGGGLIAAPILFALAAWVAAKI
jgi:DNA-directed RNA polymerase subunit RPC12/RpoP